MQGLWQCITTVTSSIEGTKFPFFAVKSPYLAKEYINVYEISLVCISRWCAILGGLTDLTGFLGISTFTVF